MSRIKALLFFIIIVLIACAFVSCSSENQNQTLDEPSDDLSENPSPGEDNAPGADRVYQLDIVCGEKWLIYDRADTYEAGDIIKFHTYVHPIGIDMYVDGEFYSSGIQVSLNEYDDYIEYRLVMPNRDVTVEFKSDLVAYSSFLRLYQWLGRVQYRDYVELVIEKGPLGASPDILPESVSLTYVGDIYDVREALMDIKICEVKADSKYAEDIEGGSYIRYTFITNDEEYEIYIENNRLFVDGKTLVVFGEYPGF